MRFFFKDYDRRTSNHNYYTIPACIRRSVLRMLLRDDKIIGLRIENKNCVTQRLRRRYRVLNTNKQNI